MMPGSGCSAMHVTNWTGSNCTVINFASHFKSSHSHISNVLANYYAGCVKNFFSSSRYLDCHVAKHCIGRQMWDLIGTERRQMYRFHHTGQNNWAATTSQDCTILSVLTHLDRCVGFRHLTMCQTQVSYRNSPPPLLNLQICLWSLHGEFHSNHSNSFLQ